MPPIDQSSKLGKSSSPTIQRVIANNVNVQQAVKVPSVLKTQHNKTTVKV